MTLRWRTKTTIERLLAFAAQRLQSPLSRRRSLILAYHNILAPGSEPLGDKSLHLPFDAFRHQLDLVQRRANVVPLDAALRRDQVANELPTVAITFDDAYLGAVEWGVAELGGRALPATVFVCPGLLGGETFWWDALSDAETDSSRRPVREHALTVLEGRAAPIRAWARSQGLSWREMPDHCRTADEGTLRLMAASPGVSLGAHTWSHPNLGSLSREAVDTELRQSHGWLIARRVPMTLALAYPYGIPPRAPEAAMPAAGFSHGLLASGGWSGPRQVDTWRVPRFNVAAGLSTDGLLLRLSGWVVSG